MHIKRLITLYLLATLLILCSISYAQEASNGHKLITDRDTENLLGPVKKVTNFLVKVHLLQAYLHIEVMDTAKVWNYQNITC